MGKKFVLFTNYNGSLLRRQPGGQGVTLVMALSLEVASTCVNLILQAARARAIAPPSAGPVAGAQL